MPLASKQWPLHAARHVWLHAEDLEDREEIAAFAVSELTVKYMAPLRARDMYIVTVGIKEYTRTRVICAQRIIRLDPENEKSDRVRCTCQFPLPTPQNMRNRAGVFRDSQWNIHSCCKSLWLIESKRNQNHSNPSQGMVFLGDLCNTPSPNALWN